MYAAFASDDGASTSPIVWILLALLFLIVAAMMIAMLYIVYHFHQRFKKIGKYYTHWLLEEQFYLIVFFRIQIFKTSISFIRVSCYEYQHIVIHNPMMVNKM